LIASIALGHSVHIVKNQISVAFPEGVQMIYPGKHGRDTSKSPLSSPKQEKERGLLCLLLPKYRDGDEKSDIAKISIGLSSFRIDISLAEIYHLKLTLFSQIFQWFFMQKDAF